LGVQKGDAIALLLRNDFSFVEATWAANALGVSPIAVNWHLAEPEIAFVMKDSGAKVVIAHADLLQSLASAIPEGVKILAVETPAEISGSYNIEPAKAIVNSEHTAWEAWADGFEPVTDLCKEFVDTMSYTSGTTGTPKGVRRLPQSAENADKLFSIRDMIYGIHEKSRAIVCGPMYHGAPNVFSMRASKVAERIVLMPRFNPVEFLELVEKNAITTAFMVPTMFSRLLKLEEKIRLQFSIGSLEHVVTAAANCPVEIKKAMNGWFGPIVNEFYASTENGYVSYATAEESEIKPGTVGKALPGATIRIFDENGKNRPTGEAGEIYSALESAADFTYQNREQDREALEVNGLLASGDVGYLDNDGYLFLCDRVKDMVIAGGVNVYPAEIETVLASMPGVEDCAVFGIPDADLGEKLMAIIQPASKKDIEDQEVIAYLKPRLAGYKVPRIYEYRSELPRNDSGKIYKRKLRDPYWAKQA